MGRGSSKAGGGGGAAQANGTALTTQEQNALDRRAYKSMQSDLNDEYTAAMDALYDGLYLNGAPATNAEMMVNSIVGSGLATDPPGATFNTNVRALATANNIPTSQIKQALQSAVSSFDAMANGGAEGDFFSDMSTLANLIARKYK